ncbi:MAG: thioredoxin family protein [Myxococcota bacterium]
MSYAAKFLSLGDALEARQRNGSVLSRVTATLGLVAMTLALNLIAILRWPFAALRSRKDEVVRRIDAEGLAAARRDSSTVLAEFYADWCGPCLLMDEPLRAVAREAPQVAVVKVDCTFDSATPQRLAVAGFPTIIVFRDGGEVARHLGTADADALRGLLDGAQRIPAGAICDPETGVCTLPDP